MNDYLSKLEAELKQVEADLKIKGPIVKKLMDEWLKLFERKNYLMICLEEAKDPSTSTVTTNDGKLHYKARS